MSLIQTIKDSMTNSPRKKAVKNSPYSITDVDAFKLAVDSLHLEVPPKDDGSEKKQGPNNWKKFISFQETGLQESFVLVAKGVGGGGHPKFIANLEDGSTLHINTNFRASGTPSNYGLRHAPQ